MTALADWLKVMQSGKHRRLALILGAMIGSTWRSREQVGLPVRPGDIQGGQFGVMGACAAAICTPPLGMGLATLLNRKLWSEEDREAGRAALTAGMIGITEGAIPFAAADPLRVIPCIMIGSMTASVIAMLAEWGTTLRTAGRSSCRSSITAGCTSSRSSPERS